MGEIFLARQTGVAGFDRLVILKSLLPDLAEQAGFIDQFLDEARVAATLNHPNIVNIYEVGQWGGIYFIAMEYIRGDNLGRLLQATVAGNIDMPLLVPVRIVHDAAQALDHAHHATDTEGKPLTIVHRDIGLQNIMVRADGVTKVVDFGIARAANRSTRTRTGLVKGKLQYMSPEQVAGREVDGRSDQFSLGIVLWELATQQRLFKAENEFLAIQKIVSTPVPRPSSVRPDFPAELEAVVMRMLEREPAKRYPRCADAATDLARVIESIGGAGSNSQQMVATFVERALGEKLTEATRDLTPSTETPFASMIGLTGLQGDLGATVSLESNERRAFRRRVGLSAGVGLALVLAGLGTLAALGKLPLPTRGPAGARLEIQSPPGARVVLDGEIWKESVPTAIGGLRPGDHRLELELPGLPAIRRHLSLAPEERLVIAERPPAKGMVLDVREPKGSIVVVDGVRWHQPVPTVVTGLSEGPHEVRLELPDGRVIRRRPRLMAGTPVLLQERPPAAGMVLDIRDPEGAQVVIDGMVWREPVPTVVTGLSQGKHEVQLRLGDLPPITRRVSLEVGKPVQIAEPAPPAAMAIDIRDPEGARVVVDGKPWAEKVPTVVTGLAAGAHEVRLELPGRPAIVKRITLAADVPVLLQEQPPLERPTLTLKSRPAGATVTVGGRRMGKTPARIMTLEPEVEHPIVIEKRGYEPASLSLTLQPGERREESVTLERAGSGRAPTNPVVPSPTPPGPAAPGFLTLKTTPWVKVAIDGKPFGSTPLYKVELAPGPHALHLVNEEFGIDVKRNITIPSGNTNKLDLTLK